jgi:hypothetical protein
VSETRIENFLSGNKRGAAQVNGSALMSDFQRDRLARQARTEMLVRLFAGFPNSAFDLKIKHIGLAPQQGSDLVQVEVEIRANKEYFQSLKKGLQVLGKSVPAGRSLVNRELSIYQGSRDSSAPHTMEASSPLWEVCFGENGSCISIADINVETSLCPSSMHCFYNGGVLAFAYTFSGSEASGVRISRADGGDTRTRFGELFQWRTDRRFVINEGPYTFFFSIPMSAVPEASKDLRVVPLFLVNDFGERGEMIRDLTDGGTIQMRSEEFHQVISESLKY